MIIQRSDLIDAQKLVELSKYFTIIHHIPNRIRLRVSPKIKDLAKSSNITLEDIITLKDRIVGIKNIKINKIVGSILIEYDNKIFKDSLWSDLIEQKNLEEIVKIVENLHKKIEKGEA